MTTTIDPLLFGSSTRSAGYVSHSRQAAASHRSRPSQRTFRRRRRVLGASVVFAVVFGVLATGAVASDPAQQPVGVPRTVIAQPGDTLWDIARTIVPNGAIGDLVTDMVRLNGSHIEPGQVVRIP